MTLSTHYTKDALESIFATAQNAEFMGIISAYRTYKMINGKKQAISEQENFYRHKFLGLMLNERGISCVSFCAVSKTLYKQDNNSAQEQNTDSSLQGDTGSKYEWCFYLVWGENTADCIEIGKLGRACGNAYYLSSGGVMHGFAPHKRGIGLKPYIGKRRISPQRVINMFHRWFLETEGTELIGIRFYQTMENSSLRQQARGSLARFHNISYLYYALPRFDKQNPRIDAEEYLRSDSMITESITNKTLSPFMLRYIFEERGLMFVDKSSYQSSVL